MLFNLGSIDSIQEKQSKGYSIKVGDSLRELFIVNFKGQYYAYENRCPHTGISLNWQPDQFLNIVQSHIQCSTHGATFRIHDGYCEDGPCLGKSLRAIPVNIKNKCIFISLKSQSYY